YPKTARFGHSMTTIGGVASATSQRDGGWWPTRERARGKWTESGKVGRPQPRYDVGASRYRGRPRGSFVPGKKTGKWPLNPAAGYALPVTRPAAAVTSAPPPLLPC